MAVKELFFLFLLPYFFASTRAYESQKVDVPPNCKVFTNDDIAQFDGSDPHKPIYMAVKGVVFDVSSGKDFYGAGAGYHALAGKDCTRAVAKWSLDAKDLNSDISDLSGEQLKALDEIYKSVYASKYPVVGCMDYLVAQSQREKEL